MKSVVYAVEGRWHSLACDSMNEASLLQHAARILGFAVKLQGDDCEGVRSVQSESSQQGRTQPQVVVSSKAGNPEVLERSLKCGKEKSRKSVSYAARR